MSIDLHVETSKFHLADGRVMVVETTYADTIDDRIVAETPCVLHRAVANRSVSGVTEEEAAQLALWFREGCSGAYLPAFLSPRSA